MGKEIDKEGQSESRFKIGEKIDDPLQRYLADIFTISAKILPECRTLAVPCGAIGNLPAGLQIMGKHFDAKHDF